MLVTSKCGEFDYIIGIDKTLQICLRYNLQFTLQNLLMLLVKLESDLTKPSLSKFMPVDRTQYYSKAPSKIDRQHIQSDNHHNCHFTVWSVIGLN